MRLQAMPLPRMRMGMVPLTHDGNSWAWHPTVFGMNFQGVSVGQKLAKDNSDGSCTDDTGSLNGQPGGYKDGTGTPTDVLDYALQKKLGHSRDGASDLSSRTVLK